MSEDPRLLVPGLDEEPWPSLGGYVCDFIEDLLCHGPGDVLGEPVELTDEVRLLIWRAYEVFPKGHPQEGRRRFKRVAFSRRKGVGKTEIAAWVAIAEMHPTAEVRFDGWAKEGGVWAPRGRPVRDPYIPMVATTEEQVDDLAYGAVLAILERCEIGNEYDLGLERVVHKTAPGKIQPLASAPRARDGARTTFQHFDETHLFIETRLKKAHATMLRNIPKRAGADPWSFETTTMYGPGEESVAEDTHEYALAVKDGRVADSRLLFDHRQASEKWDLSDPDQLRGAIREASGDAWSFTDVESIIAMFVDPTSDENELRRYWLNQRRRSSSRWGPSFVWPQLVAAGRGVPEGTKVVLAFDGSYSRDSTVLVGATVEAVPHIFLVKAWERPLGSMDWRTPRNEVESVLAAAMNTYDVVELAPDPPGWHREIEDWEATYGEVVVRFETNQPSRMGPACDDFEQAVRDGELTHDGSNVFERHLNNAVPVERHGRALITKEDKSSPHKIDAAVGAVIAHHRARWHYTNRPQTKEPMFAWT